MGKKLTQLTVLPLDDNIHDENDYLRNEFDSETLNREFRTFVERYQTVSLIDLKSNFQNPTHG